MGLRSKIVFIRSCRNMNERINLPTVNVISGNGPRVLHPVFCEITGEQICWQTDIEGMVSDVTPSYLSFEVVDQNGRVKMADTLLEVITF